MARASSTGGSFPERAAAGLVFGCRSGRRGTRAGPDPNTRWADVLPTSISYCIARASHKLAHPSASPSGRLWRNPLELRRSSSRTSLAGQFDMRTLRKLLLIAMALHCTLATAQQTSTPPGQITGGVQAAEPKFRLVRSVSGSKGAQQGGRYVIQDPRTVFYIPEDRQVIVYFEWEGPIGLHRFEGLWKNPESKVAVLSDFWYEA